MKIRNMVFLWLMVIVQSACAQSPTLQEKLGYKKSDKLLIIHADDLGVSHSENEASIDAMENGSVNSASIMVPCPWFPEIANYAKNHQEMDFGLHLTLTAEWEFYKWDGVLSSDKIATLLNEEKYFYPDVQSVVRNGKPEEVAAEIDAQVKRALSEGINVTHLDSHMGTLFNHPNLFKAYLETGRKHKIPVLIPRDNINATVPHLMELTNDQDIIIDKVIMAGPEVKAENWTEYYSNAIKNLSSGVSEIIIHCAYDNPEMQGVAINHPDYGAEWRQRDYDFFSSEECKKLLEQEGVILVTWGEMKKLLEKESK